MFEIAFMDESNPFSLYKALILNNPAKHWLSGLFSFIRRKYARCHKYISKGYWKELWLCGDDNEADDDQDAPDPTESEFS